MKSIKVGKYYLYVDDTTFFYNLTNRFVEMPEHEAMQIIEKIEQDYIVARDIYNKEVKITIEDIEVD